MTRWSRSLGDSVYAKSELIEFKELQSGEHRTSVRGVERRQWVKRLRVIINLQLWCEKMLSVESSFSLFRFAVAVFFLCSFCRSTSQNTFCRSEHVPCREQFIRETGLTLLNVKIFNPLTRCTALSLSLSSLKNFSLKCCRESETSEESSLVDGSIVAMTRCLSVESFSGNLNPVERLN